MISFVFLGLYWNNHHHLLHFVKRIDGWIMWANMCLLFWLTLVPVTTGWIGEHHGSAIPVASHGAVLFMASIAWQLLQRAIIHRHGRDSELARAVGLDLKGRISFLAYLAAIGLAFVVPWVSIAIYVSIAIAWLVPDRRIEHVAEDALST